MCRISNGVLVGVAGFRDHLIRPILSRIRGRRGSQKTENSILLIALCQTIMVFKLHACLNSRSTVDTLSIAKVFMECCQFSCYIRQYSRWSEMAIPRSWNGSECVLAFLKNWAENPHDGGFDDSVVLEVGFWNEMVQNCFLAYEDHSHTGIRTQYSHVLGREQLFLAAARSRFL